MGEGKPDWLIDLFPPPFSDSAVIHILINVWWGFRGSLLGPGTVYPIAPVPQVKYKNQPQKKRVPGCTMNPSWFWPLLGRQDPGQLNLNAELQFGKLV